MGVFPAPSSLILSAGPPLFQISGGMLSIHAAFTLFNFSMAFSISCIVGDLGSCPIQADC